MKRSLAVLLAAFLSLVLAACQPPAEPEPSTPPPPSQSGSPAPEPAPEPEPAPAPPPALPWEDLIVSSEADCRALLTWDEEAEHITLGPRCGDIWLCFREDRRTGERFLTAVHLETGELAGLGFAIPQEADVAASLTENGAFFLCDGLRRRSFRWQDGALVEQAPYDLPEKIRGQVTEHHSHGWGLGLDRYWDVLPEQDLLAWCSRDGIWLAAADGTGSRLAVPREEVFALAPFAQERKSAEEAAPGFTAAEELAAPRLVNGGKTLTALIYTGYDLSCFRGHLVLDIPTGTFRWYPLGPASRLGEEFLNDTTLLFGDTKVDLAVGTEEQVTSCHPFRDPRHISTTADFLHYFTAEADDSGDSFLTYRLEGGNLGMTPEELIDDRRTDTLLRARKGSLYGGPAVDDRQCLCWYRWDEGEALLLVTAPEDPPPPTVIVAPGTEVRTLLTWNRDEKTIRTGPLCLENKQILYETAGDRTNVLGMDLETGELDFTLPLPKDHYLRTVLGEPGEFLVMGKTGCRRYVWREDGWLGEYPAYTLPDQARKAMERYDLEYCHFLWDYLPEQDLLAWTQGDGVWLSALDGSGARLAIPTKEVFGRPEFDYITQEKDYREYYREYFELSDPNTDTGPLLVEPRIMADGNILVASAYLLSILGDFCVDYGLEVLDIPTGERNWYEREHLLVGSFQFLDKTSLVLEHDKIDVVHKTKEPLYLEYLYEWPGGRSYSKDGMHFFDSFNTYEASGESHLFCYAWKEEDGEYYPDIWNQQGRLTSLLTVKYGWSSDPVPLDSRRALWFYQPNDQADRSETLLLVTAPENNES